jgi:hypothetical protein
MDIQRIYRLFIRGFRRRRMRDFAQTFDPRTSTRVLDVGGTPYNWQLLDSNARVTLLNLRLPEEIDALPPQLVAMVGDATCLEFESNSFDVGFSNSVIEHVGSRERQAKLASEIRRVARGLWVQTPARSFPIEPHLLALFVHYLPLGWQRHLVRRFTLWGWISRPSQQRIDQFLRETRLLSHADMREFFPDCEIRRERFLGLTKSYIAVRLCGAVDARPGSTNRSG